MKLFYEGSMQATYEMADALLRSYGILDESEWMEHFSDVIGSFCEIFGMDYYILIYVRGHHFKPLHYDLEGNESLNEQEDYLLKLIVTTLSILEEEKTNG